MKTELNIKTKSSVLWYSYKDNDELLKFKHNLQ